jgi:hypothetical protein
MFYTTLRPMNAIKILVLAAFVALAVLRPPKSSATKLSPAAAR